MFHQALGLLQEPRALGDHPLAVEERHLALKDRVLNLRGDLLGVASDVRVDTPCALPKLEAGADVRARAPERLRDCHRMVVVLCVEVVTPDEEAVAILKVDAVHVAAMPMNEPLLVPDVEAGSDTRNVDAVCPFDRRLIRSVVNLNRVDN